MFVIVQIDIKDVILMLIVETNARLKVMVLYAACSGDAGRCWHDEGWAAGVGGQWVYISSHSSLPDV